jgi:diacylglycerol kinase (ATP)
MHNIVLYYNDTAGNYQLGEEKLTALLDDYGYHVIGATPIEKGFKLIENKPVDLIVIAGGDGSIKNICLLLVKSKLKNQKIGILPFGTANNIALHLGYKLKSTLPLICKKWDRKNVQNYDLGHCAYNHQNYSFVEAIGLGIFPYLIQTMQNLVYNAKMLPSEEIKIAIKKLYKSMFQSQGKPYKIIIDANTIEDDFLLIEIMNIQSIGPRWKIAPNADCADGYLDLVYITSAQKPILIQYLKSLAQGKNPVFPFKSTRIQKVTIIPLSNSSVIGHLDDQLIEMKPATELNISITKSYFQFLV